MPIEIDEAFEVEVEVDGIYVGDSKQVGNNAVGATATSYVEVAFASCIRSDVPVDEKVGDEVFLFDDFKLLLQASTNLFVGIVVAVPETFTGKFSYELIIL